MSQLYYPVAEKFVSINGEGRRVGELAAFIRFRECNLNCSYCDTQWANTKAAPAALCTIEQLLEFVKASGVKNVTLTGGEPLLQNHLDTLIRVLLQNAFAVEIETNGSLSIKHLAESPYRPSFTLDYKLPSSGMEWHMLTENYPYLSKEDTIKFVAGSKADLEKALEMIEIYQLTERCRVYFSPVFDKLQPSVIVDFMKANQLHDVRLQLQLHKYIWSPDRRGV